MTELLTGLHTSYFVAIAAALQMAFAAVMVHLVSSYRRLTPLPPLGRFSLRARRFCQFMAALAWVGVLLGAGTSCFGILVASDAVEQGMALNDLGIFLSRLSGPVIMIHTLGMAWEFLKALERKAAMESRL